MQLHRQSLLKNPVSSLSRGEPCREAWLAFIRELGGTLRDRRKRRITEFRLCQIMLIHGDRDQGWVSVARPAVGQFYQLSSIIHLHPSTTMGVLSWARNTDTKRI